MANNDIQYLQGIDTVAYVRLLENVANLSLTKHHWTLIHNVIQILHKLNREGFLLLLH